MKREGERYASAGGNCLDNLNEHLLALPAAFTRFRHTVLARGMLPAHTRVRVLPRKHTSQAVAHSRSHKTALNS